MIAPEVLDALLKAGATADMIVAAVKADGALDEAKIDARRAKDAERQRRHRMSRDVTVTACDVTDDPFPPCAPPKVSPTPPTNTPPLPPKPKTEARGARLSEDWQPKVLSGKAQAMVACWQAGALERELAKFKNYWLAKGGAAATSTNWQRNWVNWLINADERKPRYERSDRDPTTVALERLIGTHAGTG